ncbi:hypothetical protein GPECTOR_55g275 [Gonium pectorale]|uniref:Glycosyl transferase CAP10 domain-containing protein n=1 Tax=Gonium pectorale TaxID=33097 RepID=A0A150G661_GONPE|nr:hypothetical protein GPECTOR_55g275 [Gonium pectorale]|eukprot:KXZ45369.1 hypothetical protein GPECTOR_55g275 [Gonium pectorale]
MHLNKHLGAEWNHSQSSPHERQGGITLWVTASQWYFERLVEQGMDFPDSFFFLSDQDSGWCTHPDSCAIPALSIAKDRPERVDLLFPFMVGSNHSLYNFPFQLKLPQAFFSGRPNWGASERVFEQPNGTATRLWSRKHLSQLSAQHGSRLVASLLTEDAASYPGCRVTDRELPIKEHARWRFLLALDGVTYSSRLGRVMHTDSVILREASPWAEYYYRALREGVHYLPVLKDGPDDVLDLVASWENRTRDLQELAWRSQSFALRYLCPRARMLYFRRLLSRYMGLFRQPDGSNAMTGFISEVLVPIIQARRRGDMETTYMGIRPYVAGRRSVLSGSKEQRVFLAREL